MSLMFLSQARFFNSYGPQNTAGFNFPAVSGDGNLVFLSNTGSVGIRCMQRSGSNWINKYSVSPAGFTFISKFTLDKGTQLAVTGAQSGQTRIDTFDIDPSTFQLTPRFSLLSNSELEIVDINANGFLFTEAGILKYVRRLSTTTFAAPVNTGIQCTDAWFSNDTSDSASWFLKGELPLVGPGGSTPGINPVMGFVSGMTLAPVVSTYTPSPLSPNDGLTQRSSATQSAEASFVLTDSTQVKVVKGNSLIQTLTRNYLNLSNDTYIFHSELSQDSSKLLVVSGENNFLFASLLSLNLSGQYVLVSTEKLDAVGNANWFSFSDNLGVSTFSYFLERFYTLIS